MNQYLKNPYVLIGLFGLGVCLYKRRKVLRENPNVAKSIADVDKMTTIKGKTAKGKAEVNVSQEFIDDVASMDKATLKKTLDTNKRMLKRARLDKDKKLQVTDMLKYLQDEYNARMGN